METVNRLKFQPCLPVYLMTSFAYEQETPSCFFQYVLFDITSKKWVLHKDVNDEITKLSHMKNRLNLHYETSSFEGLYPRYHLHVEDQNQELKVDIDYIARSLPHWIAQETTFRGICRSG